MKKERIFVGILFSLLLSSSLLGAGSSCVELFDRLRFEEEERGFWRGFRELFSVEGVKNSPPPKEEKREGLIRRSYPSTIWELEEGSDFGGGRIKGRIS